MLKPRLPIEFYSLCDLLPAGTLQFHACRGTSQIVLNNEEEHLSWETLEQRTKDVFTLSQNPRFVELEFLTEHRFIRPQWKLFGDSLLHVRIYLIPFDYRNDSQAERENRRFVLKDATPYLMSLLSHTNRASLAWYQPVFLDEKFEPFFSPSENIFLAQLYSDLPSPKISSDFLQGVSSRMRNHYLKVLTGEKPPGLKSTLFNYQKRTIASMIQRELGSKPIPDPHFIPIRGVENSDKVFYLRPSPLEICERPSTYPPPSGGILCEEMGTGKTCIILGLIMATKGHIAKPEKGDWGEPVGPILSELGLRYFPFPNFEDARKLSKQEIPPGTFPSLTEILIHYIKSTPEVNFAGKHGPEVLSRSSELLRNHTLFYRVNATKPSRGAKSENYSWRQYYLTSATLIVVPRAIVSQWNSEINKHCDTSSLRLLFLDGGDKAQKIPPAPRLASDYDIVLLTVERFSPLKVNKDELVRDSFCRCPTPPTSRIPDCCCKQNSYHPLMQVRWKRLVVDEGHKMGTKSNCAERCQGLKAEHRWIVSGTPTPNLMGLGLGKSESNEATEFENDRVDLDTASADSSEEVELRYPYDVVGSQFRRWSKEERSDLKILGEMLSRFFALAPYTSIGAFLEQVVDPVMQPSGPRFGSISVLRNIMALIMFRHRIKDIEKDLPKLPIEEKIVKLKFQPLAARTYNILQSLIAVNAVDSQRKDQDYFFHPSAQKHLRTVLENLSQTLFWKIDTNVFDIYEAIQRTRDAKETAMERKVSAPDLELVCESLRIQEEAVKDDLWTQVMSNGDHVYSVRGLTEKLGFAWSKIYPNLFGGADTWVGAERLLAMQNTIHTSPLISEEKLMDEGFKQEELEQQRLDAIRPRKGGKKAADKKNVKVFKFPHGRTLEENQVTSRSADSNLETRIPQISICKSASSKVLKHAPKHKFLIFSSMPLSLEYVAEALRLAQVRYLLYVSSEMTPDQRRNNVVTFETNKEYRVLLIELKLGARGLNLIAGSRIIFCEPVWHADIEAQAIKRSHRLGQKSDKIKVVTLVMEGTYEETMITRRAALQNQLQEKVSSFESDVTVRHVLQNPKFITTEYIEEDSHFLDIPLVKPFTNSKQAENKSVEIEDEGEIDPPRKRVRFNEE